MTSSDVISAVSEEVLLGALGPAIPIKKGVTCNKEKNETALRKGHQSTSEVDPFANVSILDVIDTSGFIESGDQLFGPHPIHGSDTGHNLVVKPATDEWWCGRHSTGGGPAIWLAVEEGIIDCSEAVPGALKGEKFVRVLEAAERRGLIPKGTVKTSGGRGDKENVPTVEEAILYLDSCCDGATTTDGAGFSKYDVEAGKRLANKIRSGEKLNKSEKRKAMRLAHKYRKQLEAAGIDHEAAIKEAEKDTKSASTKLVEFVSSSNSELWHSPEQDAFITIEVNGHWENHPLRTKHIRQWLSKQFYEEESKVPHNQGLQDALGLLEGKAIFDGPEYPVYLRVAGHEGNVYVDIGDESWDAIEITPKGWQIIPEAPAKFRRPDSLHPLPRPVSGGRIEDLRKLVNAPTDDIWILSMAWLIQTFYPKGPYTILIINGEQGSAKSTFSRHLRSLIDPNSAPLRRPPKNEEDLMIAAKNGWTPCYDNLSGISRDLSDGFCVLATGGGLGKRQLYTDDEEHILYAQRPLILNGIDEVATRGDLMERSIIIHLPPIKNKKRRTEEEINIEFESIRAGVLGGILDAVATGLRRLPETKLDNPPRMADFARWIVACEPALPWGDRKFLEAYRTMSSNAKASMIESDFFTTAVYNFAIESLKPGADFTDTVGSLLNILNARSKIEPGRREPDGWPRTPRGLTNKLTRMAPVLRSAGVDIQFLEKNRAGRRVRIRLSDGSRQSTLAIGDGTCDGSDGTIENSHRKNEPPDACCDGSDGCDGTDKRKLNERGGGTGKEKERCGREKKVGGTTVTTVTTVTTGSEDTDFECDGTKENSHNRHPTVTPEQEESETEQQDDPNSTAKREKRLENHSRSSAASSSDKPSLHHQALKRMVNVDGYLTPVALAKQTGYNEIKSKVELDRAVHAYDWTQKKIGFEHQYYPPSE